MKTVEELAREADQLADAEIAMPGEYHPDWHDVRDRYYRDLVLEEAALKCNMVSLQAHADWKRQYRLQDQGRELGAEECVDAIRAMKGQK